MAISSNPSTETNPLERARLGARADGRGARRCRTRGATGKPARRGGDAEHSAAPRAALYDEVTARIVAELEVGRVPWVQPWDTAAFAPGLPRNADTRRAYSGINILMLWAEAARRGFPAQGWLTFRQAMGAGGTVRKGEKGTTIFYAARFTPKGEAGMDERNGSPDADGEDRSVPFLKRFTVFNVAQCEGLPDRCTQPDIAMPPRVTVPRAEALIVATGADVRIGGNEAYYSPAADYVALPPQQAFRHQIDYYRTALHELGHWTGHPSRLGRDQTGGFASEAYAREELCAELASAFLCAALAIEPTVRHADYIGGWLDIMHRDARAIFKAASHASKAADYLLSFAPQVAAVSAGDRP
ncbi:ArdC family protein [Sphingopyxis sp. MWB1]|uniref:ArdC family protein n=1 Tax=Sphingopyxis sp. MWB1 TaxID=1537715 RepID=UPI0009DED98F|nr:zincin-like metallopeptidase domain-containing protein [Sphingopyxis sp. MWB1]